jgi:putative ABC transport system substrate-binding protein
MRRREFIAGLAGAAAAWPPAARAQQPALPVIGYLSGGWADGAARGVAAFRQGLKDIGYVDGQNVAIEYRWAEGQDDRLPGMVADLARRQVAVIATGGRPSTLAAKAVTTTTPIVFAIGADPVAAGLVASLNRPGGNLTGVTSLAGELVPKRLELLHELVSKATVIAVLVNPANPGGAERVSRDAQAATSTLGLQLHVLHARSEREFDMVFATLVQLKAGALMIAADALFNARSRRSGSTCDRMRDDGPSPFYPSDRTHGPREHACQRRAVAADLLSQLPPREDHECRVAERAGNEGATTSRLGVVPIIVTGARSFIVS